MKYAVTWRRRGILDLQRLEAFASKRGASFASRLASEIVMASRSLAEFPERCRVIDDVTSERALIVERFSQLYVLCFVISDGEVIISRVWHSRESRPGM